MPTHQPRATCTQRFGDDTASKKALRRAKCRGSAGVLSSVLLNCIEGREELAILYQLRQAPSVDAPEEKQIYKWAGGGRARGSGGFLEEVAPKGDRRLQSMLRLA